MHDDRYDYQTLVEYADVDGIEECMKPLRAAATTLTDKSFAARILPPAIRRHRGTVRPARSRAEGHSTQHLRCNTACVMAAGGSTARHAHQDWGEARPSASRAPRELRPFLCCRWGIDIDMISAHASFFLPSTQVAVDTTRARCRN